MRETAELLMSAIYKNDKQAKISDTRNAFADTTRFILENLKDSREKNLALNKLEEACMWAIKSITREEGE